MISPTVPPAEMVDARSAVRHLTARHELQAEVGVGTRDIRLMIGGLPAYVVPEPGDLRGSGTTCPALVHADECSVRLGFSMRSVHDARATSWFEAVS